MRNIVFLAALLMVTACGTIQRAQFNSAREDAAKQEATCHSKVMGVDEGDCRTNYPNDASLQQSDPYYVNVQRAECLSKAWEKGALSQPDKNIAEDMNIYAYKLYLTAHDVQDHKDTNANRNAELGKYQMDKFQFNTRLARAHMQCHTAGMASTMSSYPIRA